MKKLVLSLVVCAASVAAQADVLVQPGSKGRLHVVYEFVSGGNYVSQSKDNKRDWKVSRTITIDAIFTADKPQAIGVLHKDDPKQQQKVAGMQANANAAFTKAQPMMNDMAAIAQRCETESAGNEAKFESCITGAVTGYAAAKPDMSAMNAAKADADKVVSAMSGTRFQAWKFQSMNGNYVIDETLIRQVYEMTCTDTKICRRTETRKGAGPLPPPPAGQSFAGAFWVEVDSANKDLVALLPTPLGALEYTKTVVTTIPGEKDSTGKAYDNAWPNKIARDPIKVTIPANAVSASGSKELKIDEKFDDGGTIRVNWTFTKM